ncbi:penicillin acylase family protein [Streptomyces albus]|uniref:penicillin acylase family protein n=1 Tax=Streptomyces albus TaxID=1888 RepID=UPI0033CC50F3
MTALPPGTGGTRRGGRVRRTAPGVPVIEARDREEAAFELGRAVAEDRMFQLDLLRRRATGRLAELLGPDAVGHDIAQRTLGIARAADRHLARLPPDQRALVESHAAGIEQARCEQRALPVEFRILDAEPGPWTAADCLSIGLLLAQMLGGDGADLRMRDVMERSLPPEACAFFLPERGPYATEVDGTDGAAPVQPPPDEVLALLRDETPLPSGTVVGADESPFGSNAFAVRGERTAHGGALLAGDMHLPLTAPTLLYRVSLRYPPHRVDGVVVPGVPVVVAGASQRLAWSATRLTAADADVIELPEEDDARAATACTVRTETIRVRGADPVEVTVRDSRFGPVHGTHAGRPAALRWQPLEDGGFDLGLHAVAESANVEAACDAANRAAGPPLNLVFADAEGNIGWTVTGRFPERTSRARVVRPDQGQESWRRTVAPERLPRLINPDSGFLVSANQLTDRHGGQGRLAGNGFGARRARHAADVLAQRHGITERDLLELQLDTDAAFFHFYRDLVHEAVPVADRTSPALAEARQAVDAWDGTSGETARGLGLLILFRENLRETLFAAALRPCREVDPGFRYVWHDHELPLRSLLSTRDDRCVPVPYTSRTAFLRAHLALAVTLLRHVSKGQPATDIAWGDLNRSAIRHPLSAAMPEAAALFDLPDVPLPGCAESLNATHPGFGPAVRLVASPCRLEDAVLQLPGGQSGDPRSVHYRDQFEPWLSGTPVPLMPAPAAPDAPPPATPSASQEASR